MATELIYLHGPPAAGKFTIAKELANIFNAKIFHNHLSIDVAKSIFDFGTDEFWDLSDDIRLRTIEAAFLNKVSSLVITSCYDHPIDLPFYEKIEELACKYGGTVRPFFLRCSDEELESRVANPTRAEMGKLVSISGLRDNLRNWNCIPVPRENCITVVTERKTPAQCAEIIKNEIELAS